MPDWLIERGIGETRFARIEDGAIVETRVRLDGVVPAGTRLRGRLRRTGSQLIAAVDGEEYLLPGGAHGATDGQAVTIEVVRERIPGFEPWKRPVARLVDGVEAAPGKIAGRDLPVSRTNAMDEAGWDEVIEEARTGIVRFDGGNLRIVATPAMTLIDIDGPAGGPQLAIAAARAAGRAIVRLGIGGSIGIDFPTLKGKGPRSLVAQTIDDALAKPFERTSVNGFGFLQIIRPRRHASLVELAHDRTAFEARALLRGAGKNRSGPAILVAHPAIVRLLEGRSDWIEQLSCQIGGAVGLRSDASLPISGGYASQS